MTFRFAPFAPGYDLDAFDCGEPTYNDWLARSAERADRASTARVYLLVEQDGERVLGYHAICPTSVVRASLPGGAAHNAPDPVPGYLIAKLALDRSPQGDTVGM